MLSQVLDPITSFITGKVPQRDQRWTDIRDFKNQQLWPLLQWSEIIPIYIFFILSLQEISVTILAEMTGLIRGIEPKSIHKLTF